MKIGARLAGVVVLSVAIAWGLSWLPGFSPEPANPVFSPDLEGRLTETNMVDALVALPLDLHIAKADFRQSVLSVDLFLPQGVSGERFVYHDLLELSRFSWKRTGNVDRLLVRVILGGGADRQNKELLLAMEAKRSQAQPDSAPSESATVPEIRSYLENRYHFSYTVRWKQQM